jgi:drug/metabolite transporter (DMT)-like permease
VLWDHFISRGDWLANLCAMRVIATVTLVVTARMRGISLKVRTGLRPTLALVGVCDVAAFGLLSLGLSETSMVSVVAVLSAAFSLPTLVLARVFLNERLSRVQIAAALLIVSGVALIAAI